MPLRIEANRLTHSLLLRSSLHPAALATQLVPHREHRRRPSKRNARKRNSGTLFCLALAWVKKLEAQREVADFPTVKIMHA